MKTITGIGEILWDILPAGKVLGGAPANFAYIASQLGLEGYAVSAVGDDAPGKEILDSLVIKELKHLIEPVPYPTGTVRVSLDEKGVPKYTICENVAWDNIPFTPGMKELACRCHAVCFGTLAQRSEASRSAIGRFLDFVPHGSYRIFDINLRQNFYTVAIIEESLSRCNILKLNDEETAIVADLLDFTGMSEIDVCRRLLREYRLEMVVETKGATGSYVLTGGETSYVDTPRVEVADTVGAGDAFTGAFVAALLHGATVRDAHLAAVDISAYVCTQHGAMPKLPLTFAERYKNLIQ
jgi:fructokinase